MVDLDLATRLTPGDTAGSYFITLSDRWSIWGPSGGYIAAIALRAAAECARIRTPASFHCHFLSVAEFEPVELRVELLKGGKRSESFSVSMLQKGKLILQALVRTAAEAPGYVHQEVRCPVVPHPESLKSYTELYPEENGREPYPFFENLERRIVDPVFDASRKPPVVRKWCRFRPTPCFDDPYLDAARMLILMDTFGWRAANRFYPTGDYRAPNLDVSIWFHRFSPQSEWLLSDHACPTADRGLMGIDGRIWDGQGTLLATGSAHLVCVPGRVHWKN